MAFATCPEPGCTALIGLKATRCELHQERARKAAMPPCRIDDCAKRACNRKHQLCGAHYDLLRKYGVPDKLPHPSREDRFWAQVGKTDTCWLWTGQCTKYGYGQFKFATGKVVIAHRFSFELLVGPIPKGLQIDHVWPRCTHRNCVNPDHLEPVTARENQRRAAAKITHCPQGHEYSPENTRWLRGDAGRSCRICEAARQALTPSDAGRVKPLRDVCSNGHPLTTENTRLYRGRQDCRECGRIKTALGRQRAKERAGTA